MSQTKALDGELQLVIFAAGGVEFGLSIAAVSEIIQETEITRLPQMPSYVLGVINLRDKVIPIVDLGERLAMHSPAEADDKGKILVVEQNGQLMGYRTAEVSEVVSVPQGSLETPSSVLGHDSSSVVEAICKLEERLVPVLNIAHLFAADQQSIHEQDVDLADVFAE